jgi:hypothetical protein
VVATSFVLGCLFIVAGTGAAGDDKHAILKIAAAIEKGDADGAAKQAKALAKTAELEEVMHLFKPRKKQGLGVGTKPGALTPDGIEQMLITLGRDAPTQAMVAKGAKDLERMGYITAAVAEFSIAKPSEKATGAKKSDWTKMAKEMREMSIGFAEAAKSKSPASVKAAAEKLNGACNSCHTVFRE